ncbi:MAG: hypothetical protein WA666_04825 [Nitrospirota bacterium]
MTEEQKEKIRKAASGHDGKLPCPVAFALCKETGVPLKEIGAFCNEENIRIKNCQLGCFP